MDSSSIFAKTAKSHIDLPPDIWRTVEKNSDLDIKTLDRAVVFILAVWSGPSAAMLKGYSAALASLRPDNVPLIATDIDSIQEISVNGFPPTTGHGIGETYFIKHGIIEESIISLIRKQTKTVSSIPQPIDVTACVDNFSRLYRKYLMNKLLDI